MLAAGSSARGWQDGLPVLAARGIEDGPTLLVTGGVHGDEYEGPEAIYRLFASLDAAQLRGRLLAVPVCNVGAWKARARASAADGINLNRVFPGSEASATARLAEVIFATFVLRCDALIDLHSGGAALDHLPLIGWYRAGNDGEAERLARRFDARLHPWRLPDAPGVLSFEAQRIGKTALGAEWRGGGRLDPVGADAYRCGLRRLLAALEMQPSDTARSMEDSGLPDERLPIGGDYQTVTEDGLFVASVTLGDRVQTGDRLGTLRELLGTETSHVTAERSGTVAGLAHLPLLRHGDRVAYIG
jgi:predicted deacylase